MAETAPKQTPPPEIRLSRLRIRRFRGIEDLDVQFPTSMKVLCFVGANGSGKSSVVSWLIEALCRLTHQPEPGAQPTGGEWSVRKYYTGEIAVDQSAYLVRSDWKLDGRGSSFLAAVKHRAVSESAAELFPDEVRGTGIEFGPGDFSAAGWTHRPDAAADPPARSVFLVRPSDRFEPTGYDPRPAPPAAPLVDPVSSGRRRMPVFIRTWSQQLEELLLELELDKKSGGKRAQKLALQWATAYEAFTGKPWVAWLTHWPNRHFGPADARELPGLSAGEMDVLGTVAQALAQQVCIAVDNRNTGWRSENGPEGWVFIDEADLHLHPVQQQKVVPLLSRMLPDMTLVITTNSPFVVRSLPAGKSCVVRLPDGVMFQDDFTAQPTDEILDTVFGIKSEWNPEIEEKLERLRSLCKDRANLAAALELFRELVGRGSRRLRSSCRGIAGAHGCTAFRDAVPAIDPPSADGSPTESYESLSAMGRSGPDVDKSS